MKLLLKRQSYSNLGLELAAPSAILDELHMRIRLQKFSASLNLSLGNEVFMSLLHLVRNTSSRVRQTQLSLIFRLVASNYDAFIIE